MNWCLTHNCFTDFPIGFDGKCLIVTCRPDKLDMSDDWVDNLPVPDSEELAQMDENAKILESDFTLFGEL